MATIRRDLFLFITAFWALFSYQEVVMRVVVAWCSLCSSRHFIILIIGPFHFRDSINFSFQTTLCHYYTLAPVMIIRHTVIVKKYLDFLNWPVIISLLSLCILFLDLQTRKQQRKYKHKTTTNTSWPDHLSLNNCLLWMCILLVVDQEIDIRQCTAVVHTQKGDVYISHFTQ